MREGTVLAARYRLLRRAAAGAMGTVYEALDALSGAHVAVKTIRIDAQRDQARDRSRLLREAEALASLRHPAVVRYLDHGVTDESEPFLVMAWLDGGETLERRLTGEGLTPLESLELAARLASGLAAVHARGVVHRDLKPSNVMLVGSRVADAVLVDFGIARLARSSVELTATGDHLGTPCYMSPEQIRNPRTVDARADVFALGCILFECLTGQICFGGDDAVQVLARILFASPPLPSALRADLPRVLDELVATMLRRDANARPLSSVAERMLRDTIESLSASTQGLPPPKRGPDPGALAAMPTVWDASEELPPPPSFHLGANAVASAAHRALPFFEGAFVGREATCLQLASTLRAGAPRVVVWGGPGIGKTRLVVETVRQMARTEPPWDALVYGDLRDARTADDVVRLLARESGISLQSSVSPEIALGRALGKLGRVLLVLDPVEHLADLLAATLHAFARASPGTQVLAISRRRWSVLGAASVELGPLSTSTVGANLSPAATLLLERGGWLHADDDERSSRPAPAVMERAERLARALEGIPLAIELSATHAQLLGLDGLATRVCGPRDARTLVSTTDDRGPMHGALVRSWELLTPAERDAFAQCAVFCGGFTAHAAEAVVHVKSPAQSTLALLQSLRDSSLLHSSSTEATREGRLSMFAPMQEFASERLSDDERDAALRRHATYFGNLESHRPHTTAAERIAHVEREADNLLAAAEFCLAEQDGNAGAGMKALVTLEPAIFSRGAVTEYVELLERALARAESAAPDSAEATTGMLVRQTRARLDAPSGRMQRARTDLALCLEDARRRQDVQREGSVLLDLGVVHHLERDLERARECYAAAMDRLDGVDLAMLGRCLGNIGAACHDEGELLEASRRYKEAIALLGEAGEERRRANFIGNLAVLEHELGHPEEARRLFEEALGLLEPFRDARLLAITLGNYGALELEQGQPDRAHALHARSHALLAGTEDISSQALCLARLAAALSVLGRTAEAELRLRQAEKLGTHANLAVREAVSLARGFLEVAWADVARTNGLPVAAEDHLATARGRVRRFLEPFGDQRVLRERSDDVRAMLRVLAALVERFGS